MQLALSYTIGFGIFKDNNQATILLNEYSLEHADLWSHVQLIKNNVTKPSSKSGLFLMLQREGYVQHVDILQYYPKRTLLERAEDAYKQEIQSIKLIFGEKHGLYGQLNSILASVMSVQGKWKKAEKLELQMLEFSKKTFGPEHLNTYDSMANLAITYKNQKRWKEAEKLELHVLNSSNRTVGPEHPSTLGCTANLASTYRNQGRWEDAEKLELQILESSKKNARARASKYARKHG